MSAYLLRRVVGAVVVCLVLAGLRLVLHLLGVWL
jgi:hypothetical protein